MKKLLVLPIAAIVALGACNDATTLVAPEGANFELVNNDIRVTNANVELIATFKVEADGGTVYLGTEAGVPGINSEGKPHGTCFTGGRWQNPSNRKFAAKVPHNHCVVIGVERMIGLEPITAAHWTQDHGSGTNLRTSYRIELDESGTMFVNWHAASNQEANREMRAGGVVEAHAVDQNGVRYGTFTFNLDQFAAAPDDVNLFGEYEAQTEDGGVSVFGLSRSIEAIYTHPDGSTETVEGTLYWTER